MYCLFFKISIFFSFLFLVSTAYNFNHKKRRIDILLSKGIENLHNYKYSEALKYFTRAIKINKSRFDALYLKSRAFFKLNQYQASLNYLQSSIKALKSTESNESVYLYRSQIIEFLNLAEAEIYYTINKIPDALIILNKMIIKDKGYIMIEYNLPRVFYLLAECYRLMSSFEKAHEFYLKSTQLGYLCGHIGIINSFFQQDNYIEAIRECDKFIGSLLSMLLANIDSALFINLKVTWIMKIYV